jgi:hypothetical protein
MIYSRQANGIFMPTAAVFHLLVFSGSWRERWGPTGCARLPSRSLMLRKRGLGHFQSSALDARPRRIIHFNINSAEPETR